MSSKRLKLISEAERKIGDNVRETGRRDRQEEDDNGSVYDLFSLSQTPPTSVTSSKSTLKNRVSSSSDVKDVTSKSVQFVNNFPGKSSPHSSFSIASAISNHKRRQNSSKLSRNHQIHIPNRKDNAFVSPTRINDDIARDGSSATDIIAIVLSTTIRHPTPYSKTTSLACHGSKVHLLIGDDSLPSGKCARVSFNVSSIENGGLRRSHVSVGMASLLGLDGMGRGAGTSLASPMKDKFASPKNAGRGLMMLQPGDVVRLNRIEIRDIYDDSLDGASNNEKFGDVSSSTLTEHSPCCLSNGNSLLTVICDFLPSWQDPATGPSLSRLCRIIPSSKAPDQGQRLGPSQHDGFSLEWESIIPASMETSHEVVKELACWYCKNACAHFSMQSTSVINDHPCRRRRLRDITAPSMLSNVVVKVLRCEKINDTFSTPRKNTSNGKSLVKSGLHVTYAILSDGPESDDLLGFRGSGNNAPLVGAPFFLQSSISTVLLQSMREGSYILLTHVLSQSTRPASMGGGATLEGRESLVLVPTRETTVSLITRDHPYFVEQRSPRQEEENAFASQPLTMERASQLFSMTQHHSPPSISLKSDHHTQCRGLMVVIAPLIDIIVDGVSTSFMEGAHWRNSYSLSKFLVDRPIISTGIKAYELGPTYRSATLVLDPSKVSREMVVNADGEALKILCMDVPVEDMVMEKDYGNASTLPHPYLPHVGKLLKTLCENKVPLRWVLEQESECIWFVSNASLLEI